MHDEDPVLFLIPKHMFWAERESKEPVRAVPFGQARKFRDGSDVTLVAWGNTVEKSLEALAKIDNSESIREHGEISVELFDLRSIAPWDKEAIASSVHKTGRLVVVQEDTENCSVGQMIITYITSQPDLWNEMASPPILVSKTNVMIGYNPIYEYAALPDVDRIVAAVRRSAATRQRREGVVAAFVSNAEPNKQGLAAASASTPEMPNGNVQPITVPIMGEGIRSAKIVSLLKKPGDPVALDDDLCEVETDKAVYPIQSSFAGKMGEWKTKVGDTVDIGQELGTILTDVATGPKLSKAEPAREIAHARSTSAEDRHRGQIEPALSPTITRKLSRVI